MDTSSSSILYSTSAEPQQTSTCRSCLRTPLTEEVTSTSNSESAPPARSFGQCDIHNLNVPHFSMDALVNHIKTQRVQSIQTLAQESKNANGIPDADAEPAKGAYLRLDKFLTFLENEVRMTPELKHRTQIDKALQVMYDQPKYRFPEEYVGRARNLFGKFESERWGAVQVKQEEDAEMVETDEDEDEPPSPTRRCRGSRKVNTDKIVRYPPKNHPIWGVDGIMHGAAIKGRNTLVLNDRYNKPSARVYGHNGVAVGAWFPKQRVALFHGAHGDPQGGITGDGRSGAFSIVVSGKYDDLDQDKGEYLYYSGSGSHENTDPENPAKSTAGTLALYKSLETKQPVRVLRNAKKYSRWAPTVGLRYDGLYRVQSVRYPKNTKGGMYEQFELEYLGMKVELEQLRSRPTAKEQRDYKEIGRGY